VEVVATIVAAAVVGAEAAVDTGAKAAVAATGAQAIAVVVVAAAVVATGAIHGGIKTTSRGALLASALAWALFAQADEVPSFPPSP